MKTTECGPRPRERRQGLDSRRLSRRGLLLVLAVALASGACGEGTGLGVRNNTSPTTLDPPEAPTTVAQGGDAGEILAKVVGLGFQFKESDATVTLDESQALSALSDHYDLEVLTAREPDVIQVVLESAPGHPGLSSGHEMYVVYETGFEMRESGPARPDGSPPEEFIITQVVFLIDANTGEFIEAIWWE